MSKSAQTILDSTTRETGNANRVARHEYVHPAFRAALEAIAPIPPLGPGPLLPELPLPRVSYEALIAERAEAPEDAEAELTHEQLAAVLDHLPEVALNDALAEDNELRGDLITLLSQSGRSLEHRLGAIGALVIRAVRNHVRPLVDAAVAEKREQEELEAAEQSRESDDSRFGVAGLFRGSHL